MPKWPLNVWFCHDWDINSYCHQDDDDFTYDDDDDDDDDDNDDDDDDDDVNDYDYDNDIQWVILHVRNKYANHI